MRINMPVTANEYLLSDGESILSTTDLQGRLTYVNQDFIRVSGFTEEELIGAPHILVRHPDMPPEAFADLWATLKEGLPWTGMVKNRRKNGDFYWVLANATPLRQNGNVVGYMSVRVKPTRQQVEQATRIYASLRENKHHGLKLYRGEVLKTDLVSRVKRMGQMTLKTRLMVTTLAIMLSMLLVIAAVLGGFDADVIIVCAVVAMIAAITMAVSFSSSVIKPLREATDIANSLASGDLSLKFTSDKTDETGMLLRALNQMNVNIVAMITDIRTNVHRINTSVSEIASGNNDLSARTEAQASSLEKTASSMDEFASTVKQNADNARQANQLILTASSVAERGGQVIEETKDGMRLISESANKIADIISVIDGIAFQTNILALNAAVEAARAGEQGRGFAVVAAEVRNLAHRSAAAAKEIKGLISDSVERVETGVVFVDQAGATMNEIMASVRNVTDIMAEITVASNEQSIGIDQVNQAVNDMDGVTQRNAALVEEAAAAAESLKGDVLQLERAASVFKLGNGRDVRVEPLSVPVKKTVSSSHPGKAESVQSAAAKPKKVTAKVSPIKSQQTPASSGFNSSGSKAAVIPKKVIGPDLSSDEWEEF